MCSRSPKAEDGSTSYHSLKRYLVVRFGFHSGLRTQGVNGAYGGDPFHIFHAVHLPHVMLLVRQHDVGRTTLPGCEGSRSSAGRQKLLFSTFGSFEADTGGEDIRGIGSAQHVNEV